MPSRPHARSRNESAGRTSTIDAIVGSQQLDGALRDERRAGHRVEHLAVRRSRPSTSASTIARVDRVERRRRVVDVVEARRVRRRSTPTDDESCGRSARPTRAIAATACCVTSSGPAGPSPTTTTRPRPMRASRRSWAAASSVAAVPRSSLSSSARSATSAGTTWFSDGVPRPEPRVDRDLRLGEAVVQHLVELGVRVARARFCSTCGFASSKVGAFRSVDLDDVVAELRLHGLRHGADRRGEERVLELRHGDAAGDAAEVAAVRAHCRCRSRPPWRPSRSPHRWRGASRRRRLPPACSRGCGWRTPRRTVRGRRRRPSGVLRRRAPSRRRWPRSVKICAFWSTSRCWNDAGKRLEGVERRTGPATSSRAAASISGVTLAPRASFSCSATITTISRCSACRAKSADTVSLPLPVTDAWPLCETLAMKAGLSANCCERVGERRPVDRVAVDGCGARIDGRARRPDERAHDEGGRESQKFGADEHGERAYRCAFTGSRQA